MIAGLVRNWWVFLVRGVCAIVVGIVAFTQPIATIFTLIVVWGAFALCDGVSALWAGWSDSSRREGLWPFLVTGLVSIAMGLFAWFWSGVTLFVLLAIIAISAIARGAFEIVTAIRLRHELEHEWLLAAAGAVSLLFGIVVISRPAIGLLALVYMIGTYALVSGILLSMVAFRLRGLRNLAPRL